jgi:hypothetical protein
VLSSGAIMPARAPASIDMLQRVRRPSIDMLAIADRVLDDVTRGAGCADPRDDCEHDVLGDTPLPSRPATLIRIVFGRRCQIDCVARTWLTSVVPMPNASAPSAPWVEV